jgi:hypothetical protein
MHVRGLVTACCHHKVARDAEICPATDACSSKIVQDDTVQLCLMARFFECGPDTCYRASWRATRAGRQKSNTPAGEDEAAQRPKRDANVIVASA